MGTLPMGGSRYGCLGTSHAQRRREGVDTLPMGGSRYGLLAKGGGSSHSQGGGEGARKGSDGAGCDCSNQENARGSRHGCSGRREGVAMVSEGGSGQEAHGRQGRRE